MVTASRSGKVVSSLQKKFSVEECKPFDTTRVDVNVPESVENFFEGFLKRHSKYDGIINRSFQKNKQFGIIFECVTYPSFLENLGSHPGGAFFVYKKAAILQSIVNLTISE
jgi:hypothetical protein